MHVIITACCYHVVPELCRDCCCSLQPQLKEAREKAKRESTFQGFHNNPPDLIFHMQGKKAGMFNLGSSPGSASYGRDKNTSWKIQQSIQTETVFCSRNYSWLREEKRKVSQLRDDSMQSAGECHTASLGVCHSSSVCRCDGGACTNFFTPLPVAAGNRTFRLSHSVSEWTKMYLNGLSTKVLDREENFK